MSYTLIATPIGPLGIHWEAETLTGIDLDPPSSSVETEPRPPGALQGPAAIDRVDAILTQDGDGEVAPAAIVRQLRDYFGHGTNSFDLPLALAGTPFQHRVWALLRTIPAGETRTYGEIARALGTAARAVGQACRANPCLIVVPCHRVVAARGLGGFAGDTSGRRLALKRWLLHHEGVAE
ncbi:cysteine methyltransferase [Thiocystis minor]|uniref:methylated-DNA--[protein]-cysteine S-methyltransferase n=1 Tax=Thiocystis minor TaxID=61597 RepID=UPI001914D07D|nr:methylated-DNA--[protein]-cysteine S-methyltransferase [Thiocystis minor]MBK5963259.1 cysteine methyltransferase [Thiocystis minor]